MSSRWRIKKMIEIADSPRGQIRDYTWSPRGNFLAFSMATNANRLRRSSHLERRRRQVASRYRRHVQCLQSGVGSAGQLSLLPERSRVSPQISQIEFNYATNRTTYIYALALRKDVKHPFPPESDEVTVANRTTRRSRKAPAGEAESPAKDINRELKDRRSADTGSCLASPTRNLTRAAANRRRP